MLTLTEKKGIWKIKIYNWINQGAIIGLLNFSYLFLLVGILGAALTFILGIMSIFF